MRRNRRASFSGLGPGTAFEARDAHGTQRGAVTCILGKAGEPSHLVTAGHIFHRHAQGTALWAASASTSQRVCIGKLALNMLAVGQAEQQRDLALVELTEEGRALCRATTRVAQLASAVHPDLAKHQRVQAWLTVRGRWSREGGTHLRAEQTLIRARSWRSGYVVRNVIGVTGFSMLPGDSGTALCSLPDAGAAERNLYGACIGQLGAIGLFEPVYPLLEHVVTNIDGEMDLWPGQA